MPFVWKTEVDVTQLGSVRLAAGGARWPAIPNDEKWGGRDNVQPNPRGIRSRCAFIESHRICPRIQLYLWHGLGNQLHPDRAGPVREIFGLAVRRLEEDPGAPEEGGRAGFLSHLGGQQSAQWRA